MSKPLIVVVDDEPQVLRAIGRDLLSRYGRDYRIVRASSGQEAMEVLARERDAAQPVALVLSDQRMPGLDGVSFLAEVRRLAPAARRALLTAYADTESAIGAINRSQVDYYLQKPWDPPDQHLYPVLDDLLDDWQQGYKPGLGGVRIAGSRWLPEVHALREFLTRNHVPYEFFDTERADDRGDEARALAAGAAALPVVLLPDGVRLERPKDLARMLLADRGWDDAAIEAAIAARSTQRVSLGRPLPVFLWYWTAFPEAGGISFRDDVYGWDLALVPVGAGRL